MGRDGAVLARAYDRARARSLMDAAKAAGWGHYVANDNTCLFDPQ
jgi:hypothetical protein